MAFGARVTTVTQDYIMPSVMNDIINSSPLVRDLLTKAKKWRGEKMQVNINYTSGVAGQSISGLDTFSTAMSDTRIALTFSPKTYVKPVAVALDEVTANDTPEKVLDLITTEMGTRGQEMANELATIFYSDGTGNGSKDFLGLKGIVDDATTLATVGGQARATYTALNSTVTSSSGTISLAKLATLWDTCSDGSQQPTKHYVTKAVKSFYQQFLQAQERINSQSTAVGQRSGNTGFNTLEYMGVPVEPDGACTTGVWYMINQNYLDFYAKAFAQAEPIKFKPTDIEGNDYTDLVGMGFSWSGWRMAQNQLAMNGTIILFGELIPKGFKRFGKLTAITGV